MQPGNLGRKLTPRATTCGSRALDISARSFRSHDFVTAVERVVPPDGKLVERKQNWIRPAGRAPPGPQHPPDWLPKPRATRDQRRDRVDRSIGERKTRRFQRSADGSFGPRSFDKTPAFSPTPLSSTA